MGGLISGIGDLFGGATNNANYSATQAPLIQPVTAANVNASQGVASNALQDQSDLMRALTGGINNQNQVYNQEQGTLGTLNNLASGVGPNPAQTMLNTNTGNNIANQAALMAGQRGTGANVGLIGRQIAQQGAGIQQNAVGQAATLQAQQQLAAIQAQQEQERQLGQLAGTQVGQQIGATGNYNQFAEGNQGALLNALGGYNSNLVGSQSSVNSANSGMAQTNANNSAKQIGGLLGNLPMVGSVFAGAEGGEADAPIPNVADSGGSSSSGAESLAGLIPLIAAAAKGGEAVDGKEMLARALSKREFPDHLKAVAQIYHPKVLKMACGGMAEGAIVPGNPKVPGKNTLKNDVVPAMLTPKEIVLPLSVTQSKNPGEAAKAFVEKIKGKSGGSDFKQALREHVKNRKSK